MMTSVIWLTSRARWDLENWKVIEAFPRHSLMGRNVTSKQDAAFGEWQNMCLVVTNYCIGLLGTSGDIGPNWTTSDQIEDLMWFRWTLWTTEIVATRHFLGSKWWKYMKIALAGGAYSTPHWGVPVFGKLTILICSDRCWVLHGCWVWDTSQGSK